MAKRDYYEILGISKDARPEEIKKTYRKLAHKYHPDRNRDDDAETKFKEVSEAYEVLSNPQKREKYDTWGHQAPSMQGWGGGWSNPFDMFNDFFGGSRHARKGRDIRVEVTMSLEDVLKGRQKQLRFVRKRKCETCKGLGGQGSTCSACSGYGKIRRQNGFVQLVSTCFACQGAGVQITSQCEECEGAGDIGEERKIVVDIPKGVESGNHIRISGEGDFLDQQSPPGDLLCQILVNPHDIFQRKGRNIQCIQEISFRDACLGTTITVPALGEEEQELTIPPGTQFGQSFRIKKKGLPGMPRSRNVARGDQYVQIHIPVPEDLHKQEKQLLEQMYKKIKERA